MVRSITNMMTEMALTKEEQFDALRSIHTIIGAAATTIIGNPEFNLSKLRDLVTILNKTELGPFNRDDHRKTILEIQILTARTVAEIFEDIIPSYRIKQKQEDDEKTKLSKDVIKLRQYERTFSAIYKNYLDYLKRMLDSVKNKPSSTFYRELIETTLQDRQKLAETAVECFGKLIVAHPNFNYRDQIIANLVEFNAQTKYRVCSELAHKYLCQALKDDKLGEVSLEVTSVICDLAKKRKLSVSALLFKTLSELRLIDVKLADSEQKQKWKAEMEKLASLKKKQSRKERKRCKKMKKLKKDMLETEAHVTTDQKLKYHKQILKKLFVTYFRLLKYHEELDGERRETKKFVKLLPPVLEGVSKFAHLIDVNICNDIFPLISRLLENRDITTNCKLHCLSTVFIIYKSLECELGKVDPEQFYKHFYTILSNIDAAGMTAQELKSLDNCIHLMLIKRAKQVTNIRYCAFIRRLLILAVNLPPTTDASLLLEAIRRLFIQKPNVTALFDSSNCSDFGSGQWDIEVDDPDFSHADSSVAWEMHMLRNHTDETIRNFALQVQAN
jgi:nucleolar complex protein 3